MLPLTVPMDMTEPLIYADLSSPGYGRRRCGKGFCFLTRSGRVLKDKRLIAYCRSLVIPPAWREVWISPQRRAHILCTGLDDRARKQYIYHPLWTEQQNLEKFAELLPFAKALPELRRAVKADLRKRYVCKSRVVAAVVRLIDTGLIRVGNAVYHRENKTFGATTLLTRHACLSGATVALSFRAKSGKRRSLELDDAALARSVSHCQELPGQRLFQYEDEDGNVVPVSSSDVNDYLKHNTGQEFTAKTFRTWGATVLAYEHAQLHDEATGKALEIESLRYAASRLGNSMATARKYYVHPDLLQAIRAGDVPEAAGRRRSGLSLAETSVVRFLEGINKER